MIYKIGPSRSIQAGAELCQAPLVRFVNPVCYVRGAYICFLFLLIWFNVPKISLVGSFSGTIPDNLLVQQAMYVQRAMISCSAGYATMFSSGRVCPQRPSYPELPEIDQQGSHQVSNFDLVYIRYQGRTN